MRKPSVEQFILVTREFRSPIYVAPTINGEIQITDKKEEAEVWTSEDKESNVKLSFHKLITGYEKLRFEPI